MANLYSSHVVLCSILFRLYVPSKPIGGSLNRENCSSKTMTIPLILYNSAIFVIQKRQWQRQLHKIHFIQKVNVLAKISLLDFQNLFCIKISSHSRSWHPLNSLYLYNCNSTGHCDINISNGHPCINHPSGDKVTHFCSQNLLQVSHLPQFREFISILLLQI